MEVFWYQIQLKIKFKIQMSKLGHLFPILVFLSTVYTYDISLLALLWVKKGEM